MSDVLLKDHHRGNEKPFDTIAEAKEKRNDLISLGADPQDLEIIPPGEDGNEPPTSAEVLAEETGKNKDEFEPTEPIPDSEEQSVEQADVVHDRDEITNPEDLSEDPIGFLQSVNGDFVNRIKGKPAISKQGFRFIQQEFEISTESEVVQWVDDPLGCVVWAKAELPNGYSAEAHGEGYQFESDVSDNEFVRYADTRAKNRALSDLTSAGALAVSELQGDS